MAEVLVRYQQLSGNNNYSSAWLGLYPAQQRDNTKFVTFKYLSEATNNTLAFKLPTLTAPSLPGDNSSHRHATHSKEKEVECKDEKGESGDHHHQSSLLCGTTLWEFRLFPQRSTYISVASVSLCADRKRAEAEESSFAILHARFKPKDIVV
jgi:hypothetical protein